MFEGLSDEARSVINAAHEQARGLGQHATGTVHLLLGLLVGEAARPGPLTSTGLTLDGVHAKLAVSARDPELAIRAHEGIVLRSGWGGPGLRFTGAAKTVFEWALRRALQLGGTASGSGRRQLIIPAHLILGLLDRGEATARQIMVDLEVDLEELAREAVELARTAPMIETGPATPEPSVATPVVPDDDGMILSLFGWPAHLSTTGPAARRVIAEAKDSGHLDPDELLAAAEADVTEPPPDDR